MRIHTGSRLVAKNLLLAVKCELVRVHHADQDIPSPVVGLIDRASLHYTIVNHEEGRATISTEDLREVEVL